MSENPNNPELSKTKDVFKHMFPDNDWKELPSFNPINTKRLLTELLQLDLKDRPTQMGDAIAGKQGYADRFDLPHPDKATLGWALMGVQPIDESPNVVRGWVSDLLNEGEKIGGVGVMPITWIKKEFRGIQETTKAVAQGVGDDMYDRATATVVGVISEKGKPAGVIYFRKGERPRKGEKVRQKTPVGVAAPVKVGI